MADPAGPVRIVAGLDELVSGVDVVLCDIWGVLHDGLAAFAQAHEALSRFRLGGGRVVLVSNAPRPNTSVVAQLDALGVPRAAYDAVVTSGDVTRTAVIERKAQVVHHLGPPRDTPIFAWLDVTFGRVEEADYVLCSGFLNDEHDTVEDYRPILERMRERGLLMVCANPDLVVERGDRLIPCAGALALAYENMGGAAYYAGKPHRPIYEEALRRAARLSGVATIAPGRVLALGDAIRTDVAGAAAFGIASLLVARGIHAGELGLHEGPLVPSRVRGWLACQEVRPDAVIDRLVWSRDGDVAAAPAPPA